MASYKGHQLLLREEIQEVGTLMFARKGGSGRAGNSGRALCDKTLGSRT